MLIDNQTAHAKKLGLPDVILPNENRNDLYVNILEGELNKGTFLSSDLLTDSLISFILYSVFIFCLLKVVSK